MYTAKGTIPQNDLFHEHLPLVHRLVMSVKTRLPHGIDEDDLIQAGSIGLLEAVKKYEPSQGRFDKFASGRIYGAIIDELRRADWVPRSVRRRARELEAAIAALQHRHGRPPEDQQIAAEMGMSLTEYHQLLLDCNGSHLLSIDTMGAEALDASVDEHVSSPFMLLAEGQDRQALVSAIEALPERERLVLALYYQEGLNLKEIGATLDLSESRICQLHSQAIARLSSQLAG